MDRQSTLLLAIGMLIVAAATVSASGWVLFVRDGRASRRDRRASHQPDAEHHPHEVHPEA